MHSPQFVVAQKVVQAFDKRCYRLLLLEREPACVSLLQGGLEPLHTVLNVSRGTPLLMLGAYLKALNIKSRIVVGRIDFRTTGDATHGRVLSCLAVERALSACRLPHC